MTKFMTSGRSGATNPRCSGLKQKPVVVVDVVSPEGLIRDVITEAGGPLLERARNLFESLASSIGGYGQVAHTGVLTAK